MRDIEMLRIEKLIEEREAYESAFFSIEPTNEEINYLISEYESQNREIQYSLDDFEDDLHNPFEYEDHVTQLRDELLIRQRELYERNFLSSVDLFDKDILDIQIAAKEDIEEIEYDYDFDCEFEDYEYDPYEEEMFYHILYLKKSQFQKPDCRCDYLDYMPHDDGFCDYLDCYDYPEGPKENLNGFKFH